MLFFCRSHHVADIIYLACQLSHLRVGIIPQGDSLLVGFGLFALGRELVESPSDFFWAVVFEESSWAFFGTPCAQQPFRTTFAVREVICKLGYIN